MRHKCKEIILESQKFHIHLFGETNPLHTSGIERHLQPQLLRINVEVTFAVKLIYYELEA